MKTLAQWSVEDYHRMIAAGILEDRQVELLNGEIVEMTPEGPSHTFYGEELADYLRSQLAGKALVREARPITLSNSEPEPDIAVVQPPRDRYRHQHPRPDDVFLLVEVAQSSLAKDLELKRKLYASAGIPDYWIIDLTQHQLIVLRSPQNGDYSAQQNLQEGHLALLAFPEVTVSVRQLLK